MASFNIFGLDDILFPDSIETECPICNNLISIPLEREKDIVVCPHCNSEIEIESA